MPDGVVEGVVPLLGTVVDVDPPGAVVGVVTPGVPAVAWAGARVNIRPVRVTLKLVGSDDVLPVEEDEDPPLAEIVTPSTMTSRSNRSSCER